MSNILWHQNHSLQFIIHKLCETTLLTCYKVGSPSLTVLNLNLYLIIWKWNNFLHLSERDCFITWPGQDRSHTGAVRSRHHTREGRSLAVIKDWQHSPRRNISEQHKDFILLKHTHRRRMILFTEIPSCYQLMIVFIWSNSALGLN